MNSTKPSAKPRRSMLRRLMFPLIIVIVFWTLAITLGLAVSPFFFLNFGYLGTAIGGGLALYELLPRRKKPVGRKLAQFLVGIYMLGFLGMISRENMQIEGFFFYLLSGIFLGATLHYLVAKVVGPILFSRGWCSWACWTAAVLDYLPWDKSKGWLPGKWHWSRYVFFALSIELVLLLWFGYDYRLDHSLTPLYWLAAGNLFYYGIAILMAALLKDNRAFCKYACPITVLMKVTTRFSLLKIKGDAESCIECHACTKMCPMDIDIPRYVKNGQRILSTECILCQTCMSVCTKEALVMNFGLDYGGQEHLITRAAQNDINAAS